MWRFCPATGDDPLRLDVGAGDDSSSGPAPICQQDIDIVFVMDVSTSMGAFLDQLADEILIVDQALAALDLPAAPHYGLVVFVDDVAVLNNGTPYADVQTLQTDFRQWSDFTSSNQQISSNEINDTWPENSLDALWGAATEFQWRDGETLRMIIHTTDDTFWEGPATQDGQQILHNYADTVAALQDEAIRVFSFTATLGGQCECVDVSAGWSTDYQGDPAMPVATDGGVFDIDEILSGQVSLADAIGESIDASLCQPYTPVG